MGTLGLLLLCNQAAASNSSSIAEELFREASDLLSEHKTHEACAKFAESNRIDPQLGTLLNLASCHASEGRTATAWSEFNELAERAAAKSDGPRLTFARAHASDLQKHLTRVRIGLLPGGEVTGVRLDGEPLGTAAWGAALPLDPGAHVFTLTGPGKKARNLTVNVTPDAGTLTVDVAPLEDEDPPPAIQAPAAPVPLSPAPQLTSAVVSASSGAPPPTTFPPPLPPPRRPAGAWPQTLDIVAGGVALAGLALGASFGVATMADKQAVDHDCRGSFCDPAGMNEQRNAHSAAIVSDVGFAVGAGALVFAAGAYLVARLTGNGHVSPARAGSVSGPGQASFVTEASW